MLKRYGGIILLAVATLFAMGVGADFASYNADRSVHVAVVADDQELINLNPKQPYAYIDNETGKLVIDISDSNPNWQDGFGEGISPDAKYAFDCMFEISNDLWENVTINVTISSDNQFIQLYRDKSDEASSSINFEIDPGQSACVGMSFNGAGKEPGEILEGTITVRAEAVE
ncbi:DUF1102 domain-containing protein [Archaeoglobus veneficus]|uniref:DUF1102 domain-containing protein n=1 Tax=Archaeoglobus veneficus (strain DSM 11195 / SNP6) TaxID=693661 RepID=F2KNV3_ARCVS|nr:DUF1102 domain-containing protein [Archaeoglobus veneficus]AEA47430.1 protein of unknown function DUF1102 [Archaeoglobus veneficus SNP6]